jgi:DNA-binding response OmpR family regulator
VYGLPQAARADTVAKKNLLLVDADPRSLRVLEISLRKAGYIVAASADAKGALEMLELCKADLILSDTRLPGMDGFVLVEELRKNAEWAEIPVIFLSSDLSVESKVRGLEHGVEDYLTKPIYIKEIIARVNLVLQRKQRAGLESRSASGRARFTGSLSDMGLVDLLQTVDNSKKSGVLYLTSGDQRGAIYVRDGNVVDAELGALHGERALYRALVFSDGSFEIDFRDVRREDMIRVSTQGLLMEGMRRVDEWGRALEQLPGLDAVLEVNEEELIKRLAELPDQINAVLKHFDGKRTVLQIVDRCDQDDLETLTTISKLFVEGLCFQGGAQAGASAPVVSERPAARTIEREIEPLPEIFGAKAKAPSAAHAAATVAPPSGKAPTDAHSAPTVAPPSAHISQGPAILGTDAAADRPPTRTAPGMPRPELAAGSAAPAVPATGSTPKVAPADEPPRDLARTTLDYGPNPEPSRQARLQAQAKAQAKAREQAANRHTHTPRWGSAMDQTLRGLPLVSLPSDAQNAAAATRAQGTGAHASGGAESGAHSHVPTERPPMRQGDEDEAQALQRVRRKRKRRKRLSLVTSPGMLTAGDSVAPLPPLQLTQPEAGMLASDALVTDRPPAPPPVPSRASREPTLHEASGLARADGDTPVRVSVMRAVSLVPEYRSAATPGRPSTTTLREIRAPLPAPPERADAPSKARVSATPTPHSMPVPPAVSASAPPRASQSSSPARASAAAAETLAAQAEAPSPRRDSRVPVVRTDPPTSSQEPELPLASGPRLLRGAFVIAGTLIALALLVRALSPSPAAKAKPAIKSEPAVSAARSPEPAQPQQAQPAATAQAARAAVDPPGAPAAAALEQAQAAPPATAAQGAAAASDEQHGRAHELAERARALERAGKPRQAMQLYEAAVQLDPNASDVLGRLSMSYLNRGENQLAADYASRAVAVDPQSSEGWIVLGAARQALGDGRAARDAYKKCVEVGKGEYTDECRRMAR